MTAPACVDCGGPRSARSATGRCKACSARANRAKAPLRPIRLGPPCEDCGRGLPRDPRRRGGRCQPCARVWTAKDPARRAKASAAMLAYWSNPAVRADHGGKVAQAARNRFASDPAALAAFLAGGARAARSRLDDIPPGYRPLFKSLRRADRICAAEARRMVRQQFEREAAAVRAGALPDLETFARIRSGLSWEWPS